MKTISGLTPDVCQGSSVVMSTTAARYNPVFKKKDDPSSKFVHPGHQDAQDSMRMREAKTCRCSADILQERRRAKDEPSMSSASCCSSVRCAKLACVEIPKFLPPGFDVIPSLLPQLRGCGAAKDQDLCMGAGPGGTEDQMFRV